MQAQSGDCANAVRTIDDSDVEFTIKLGIKGVIYFYCYNEMEKGIAYFTLAARYGEAISIEQLVKLGKPVPPAARTTNPQLSFGEAALLGLSSGLNGYNEGVRNHPTLVPLFIQIQTCKVSNDKVKCNTYSY